MKVEVIEEFNGVKVGTVKVLSDKIAKELIERGLVKEVKEKAPKAEK